MISDRRRTVCCVSDERRTIRYDTNDTNDTNQWTTDNGQ
jgi:hypothetical protein